MLSVPITLSTPRTIEDADGFEWDISGSPVGIADGEFDAFDETGFGWIQFGTYASAQLSEGGREINVAAAFGAAAPGVDASRSIFVSDTFGYARFLDTFTNTTGAEITFTYSLSSNLGSDGNTTVVATGSGDTTFNTADDFLTTSDGGVGDPDDTIVTHYFQDGLGALNPTSAAVGIGTVDISYSITLAAGETASMLSFGFQNATTADAAAEVSNFQLSEYSYLEGLTLAERNRVRNFNVDDTHVFAAEGATINLFDADGFLWDLNDHGQVVGTNPFDAFDDGFTVPAVATNVSATFDEDGREVNYANFATGFAPVGVAGTRSVYVSDRLGFARFLDSFTNTTGAQVTFTYTLISNLGSDSATVLEANGDGDADFDPADFFATTSDGAGFDPNPANGSNNDPFLTHYFHDGSGLTPTTAALASGQYTVGYSLTIDAGETVSMLSFGFQNENATAAAAQVFDFDTFDYDYLAGLTLEERATVVNFDVDAQHDFSGSSDGSGLFIRDADNFAWGFGSDLSYGRPGGSTFGTPSFDIPTYNNSGSVGALADGGREINVSGALTDQAGLAVARSVYVSDTLGYARFLDSFTNTTGAAITYTFALESGLPINPSFVHLVATASGDTAYQLADTFLSADDSADGNGGSFPVGTIIFHDGTRAIPSAGTAATGSSEIDVQYTFTIKPGETLSWLTFAFQNANAADATNQVNDFFANPVNYYEGLSPQERARLMNFDGLSDTPTTGANLIIGTPGEDSLDALAGNDSVYAGPGDDTVTDSQSNVGNVDVYDGGDGIDTLAYTISFNNSTVFDLSTGEVRLQGVVNDTFANFENVSVGGTATVIGDDNDNVIRGLGTSAAHANNFSGGGGNDRLEGGIGNDVTDGGAGDDVHIVESAGDVVVEAGVGTDTVFASADYTLSGGAEVEFLRASPAGSVLARNLTGNEFSQTISGNNGVNQLRGGGGTDTFIGNGGDDIVFVDSADDVVQEASTGGTADIVFSSVNYTLTAGAHVEFLRATPQNSVVQRNLTGNEFAQSIYGNAGINHLNGLGGADTLIGLAGNDTYFIDNAGDVIQENSTGGAGDTAFISAATYTLAAGVRVEFLRASPLLATSAKTIVGNEVAQFIAGNAGNNILDGNGDGDKLTGNNGADDIYVGVDNVRDVIVYQAASHSGTGAGTFDRIFEFDRSLFVGDTTADQIDLRGLDADSAGGDQAFRFVATFTTPGLGESDGQVRVDDTGAHVNVEIDINGDNNADMIILVANTAPLTVRDFLL